MADVKKRTRLASNGVDAKQIKKQHNYNLKAREKYRQIFNQVDPTLAKPSYVPDFVKRPILVKQLVKLISEGCHYETACRAVGIQTRRFLNWMQRGMDTISPEYANFYEQILQAEAKHEMATLKNLSKHEATDWRASAWVLERRYPRNWARKQEIHTTKEVAGSISVIHRDELSRLVVDNQDTRDLARRLIESQTPLLEARVVSDSVTTTDSGNGADDE